GRVTEEAGYTDQHLLEEQVELLWILLHKGRIGSERIEPMNTHTPLDSADQCAGLVEREIMLAVLAQQHKNYGQRALVVLLYARGKFPCAGRRRADQQNAVGKFRCRGDNVAHPGLNRALRHRIELRRRRFLREGQTTLTFDRLQ